MLYYTEICLSPLEVPNENSVCIYISGCKNRCANCHYPLLWQDNYGTALSKYYRDILSLYGNRATCVCFLGEGKNGKEEHREFKLMVRYAKKIGLKTCLYCGRDTKIEGWMRGFDYVKLGSYKEKLGGLTDHNTNQKMFKKTWLGYKNITYKFWDMK